MPECSQRMRIYSLEAKMWTPLLCVNLLLDMNRQAQKASPFCGLNRHLQKGLSVYCCFEVPLWRRKCNFKGNCEMYLAFPQQVTCVTCMTLFKLQHEWAGFLKKKLKLVPFLICSLINLGASFRLELRTPSFPQHDAFLFIPPIPWSMGTPDYHWLSVNATLTLKWYPKVDYLGGSLSVNTQF